MNPTLVTEENERYFSGRTVLVTGASGFIGSRLTCALERTGASVHAVSRRKILGHKENIRWWKGDLRELDFTRKILQQLKPSLVIHLAGYAWGNQNLSIVIETFYGCLATTVNVLTAAAESGCHKIVLPGSLEEPEGPDAIPTSPYSAAKLACNAYGRMFRKVFKMEIVQTRIFMTYGPGQNDGKVIPYVILSLLCGIPPVIQNRARFVDWIYIDDVVEGIMASARSDGNDHLSIDIGSGIGVSIGSVAVKLHDLINSAPPIDFTEKPARMDEVVRIADVEATYRKTGWRSNTSLDVGLMKTVEWYRDRFNASPGNGTEARS